MGMVLEIVVFFSIMPKDSAQPPTPLPEVLSYTATLDNSRYSNPHALSTNRNSRSLRGCGLPDARG